MQYKYTAKDVERFWGYVKNTNNSNDCWEWTGYTKEDGYGAIRIGGRKGKTLSAHRISYELAYGDIPSGMCVCHKCDNPPCVNPAHLFLGTNKDNVDDRERKGRNVVPRGERNGNHKLTDSQVDEIRHRYGKRGNDGESSMKLAKIFGVAFSTILRIVKREIRA